MNTEIQFANNNNNNEIDECVQEPTELDIEVIIEDFYEYVDDINSIQCVDDIMEYLHESLAILNIDRELNELSFDDLDDNFDAPYYDDEAMDLKIYTIDNVIRLLLE